MKKLIDENEISNEIYIYYLELSNGLDSGYIQLAANFKEYGITLVPVSFKELDYFLKSGAIPLIAMADSLDKNRAFLNIRRDYLDFAIRNKKVILYHLDSFGQDHTTYSEERTGFYNRISLPVTVESLSEKIIISFNKKLSSEPSEAKWPGGNRVTLPNIKKGDL